MFANVVYRAMPPNPTFNIPEEVQEVANNVNSTITQVNDLKNSVEEDVSNIRSSVKSTFNAITSGAILDVVSNPGQAENSFCGKSVSKTKAKKIAKKTKKNILTLKSKKFADLNEYKEINDKFYADNILVIHAAAESLIGELQNDIKAQIEKAKKCAKGEGDLCGIPATDEGGNNEVLFTYGKTLETLDSIVRFWESVAALKARLAAVEAMKRITPVVATEADEVSDEDDEKPLALITPRYQGRISSHETLAFAQITYNQEVPSSLMSVEASIAEQDEASATISRTLKFMMPAPSQNVHAIAAAQEKFAELDKIGDIDNVVSSAMQAHNMLNQLWADKEKAEKVAESQKNYKNVLQKLRTSEQCAINHLSRHFADPIKVWSGVDLRNNENHHSLRKGISGYVWDLYSTAKAAMVNFDPKENGLEDYPQTSVPFADMADLTDDPDEKKANKYVSENKSDFKMSQSKIEEMQKEHRKTEILAWNWGANAAKEIITPTKDNKGNLTYPWGEPKNKIVWTDTKRFYDKYLEKKYDNIKRYLKRYTKEDVLAFVIAHLSNNKLADLSQTEFQKNRQSLYNDAYKAVTDALGSKENSDTDINGSQNARQNLVGEIDKLSAEIKSKRDEITEIRNAAQDQSLSVLEKRMTAKVKFPSGDSGASNKTISIVSKNEMDKKVLDDSIANSDEDKAAQLEEELKKLEAKLSEYDDKLKEIDNEIAIAKNKAQSAQKKIVNIKGIEDDLEKKINEAKVTFKGDVDNNLKKIVKGYVKKEGENPISAEMVTNLFGQAAEDAISDLNKKIDAVSNTIDTHLEDMKKIPYLPENHGEILDVHKKIMEALKAITLTFKIAGAITVNPIEILAPMVPNLGGDDVETKDFFVGALPQDRDFKAPMAPPAEYLPYVREVFHLDTADFAQLKPLVGDTVVGPEIRATDLLSYYGVDIPEIWRKMLQERAFVETEYNLQEALNGGCEDVAFARGGMMPCVVSGSKEVLDATEDGNYYVRKDLSDEVIAKLPRCMLMKLKNGQAYHSFTDVRVHKAIKDKDGNLLSGKGVEIGCPHSELGMILQADENNNLSFRDLAFNTYKLLAEDGKDCYDEKGNYTEECKDKFAKAQYAIFARNQIGDFLYFAQEEKDTREDLTKVMQQYEEEKNALKESLISFGFTPADDYDLAKEEDYALTVKKLKQFKDDKINSALSLIAAVKTEGNALVTEKISNLKKLISAMTKDDEAVMTISVNTADINNFDEVLKKHKADRDVVDNYKKGLKQEASGYNEVSDPFCAIY